MHKFVHFLVDKGQNKQPESVYEKFVEDVYLQTDYYIGQFMHLLDEGWTVLLVSDHAQVCPGQSAHLFGRYPGRQCPHHAGIGFYGD